MSLNLGNNGGSYSGGACFCIGPQNGEPFCPCEMRARGIFERDGHWIQPERDLGRVVARSKLPTSMILGSNNYISGEW